MTHPDRRRYGGLDLAPPDAEAVGPAKFGADFDADFSADISVDVSADVPADDQVDAFDQKGKVSADTSVDFPAEPTGPTAKGFRRTHR